MPGPLPLRFEKNPDGPTLAALELSSIAQGVETLDALVKEAPVEVLLAQPSSAGKYLIIFTGEVEEAAQSLGRGLEVAGDALIDEVLLPAAADTMLGALTPRRTPSKDARPSSGLAPPLPALGVLETFTAPCLLGATDCAAKTGEVRVEEVHLIQGIGGKSTSLVSGDVESVRVAVDAGASFAREQDLLARVVVIPRPDEAILPFLLRE